MFNRILERVIRKEERRLDGALDYVREIAKVSTAAVLKIGLLGPFTNHRKRLPKTAYHLAKITVTRHADCGECVQMALNLAASEGVPSHYLRALLDHKTEQLPIALQEVCEYAQCVTERTDRHELRERLIERYGKEGLTELAFAIASAQIYPTIKRAMGHATRCSASGFHVNESRRMQESLVLGESF